MNKKQNPKTSLLTNGSTIIWKGDDSSESGIFHYKIADTGYCKIELTSGIFKGTKTMVPIAEVHLQHINPKVFKRALVITR